MRLPVKKLFSVPRTTMSIYPRATRAFASYTPRLITHPPDATSHPLTNFRPTNPTAATATATATTAVLAPNHQQNNNFLLWWHLPDVNISERAARLSDTLEALGMLSRSILVAISGEVKGNPTESEADVAADRSDDDPLPPEKHQTIRMPAGELTPKPTESEEDVRADRNVADIPLDKFINK